MNTRFRLSSVVFAVAAMCALALPGIPSAQAQTARTLNNAAYVSVSSPVSMRAGQTGEVTVVMRNTGRSTWRSTGRNGFYLGITSGTDRWSVRRVSLQNQSVAPGQTVTFRIRITAPRTAGTYPIQWRMLQEPGRFFGGSTATQRIRVTAGTVSRTQCNDGIDNDNDGRIDYPSDTGCTSRQDTSEYNTAAACQDGIDNDYDGRIDYPNDSGCSSYQDTDESNVSQTYQCSDGIDNDNDGRIDYPSDGGCTSSQDTSEANGATDLAIVSLGTNSTIVNRGAVAKYNVTLKNYGPDATTSTVAFRMQIPTGLTFNSQETSSSCALDGGYVRCFSSTTLQRDQERLYTIAFTVTDSATCGSTIQTRAAISETPQGDPYTFNNELNAPSVTVQCTASSDISIEDTTPATARRGELLTTVLRVRNNGTTAVQTVDVTHAIPAGPQWTSTLFSIFLPGTTCGYASNGVHILCRIQNLPANTTMEITHNYRIPSTAACNSTYTLRGTATSSATDSNPNNNATPDRSVKVECDAPATGNLYVTQSTDGIPQRQILGGELSNAIMRLQLRADTENVDVTDIRFTSALSSAVSIDRLELFRESDGQPFASATIAACGTDQMPANTLCAKMNSRQLVIPSGTTVNVFVRARVKSDANGAFSGEQIQFTLSGQNAVRAENDATSNVLAANDQDSTAEGEVFIGVTSAQANAEIRSPKHIVVLSKLISLVKSPLSDNDNTNVPTGPATIAMFDLESPQNVNSLNGLNRVRLNGIIFNVEATNVLMSSNAFRLAYPSDATLSPSCAAMSLSGVTMTGSVTGNFLVSCSNLAGRYVDIQSDTGLTMRLQGEVINPKVTSSLESRLQVSLENFSNAALTTFGATGSHFEWFDVDFGFLNNMYRWIEHSGAIVRGTLYKS